jgi:WD40 repeat protein
MLIPTLATYTKEHQYVVTGTEDGDVMIFTNKKSNTPLVQTLPGRASAAAPGTGHYGVVMCVASNGPNERHMLLASGSRDPDCSVKIWKILSP